MPIYVFFNGKIFSYGDFITSGYYLSNNITIDIGRKKINIGG